MSVAPKYQEALDKAGYKYKLKYNPESATDKPKKQNRKRNILWFNPPYCSTVKTNVGGRFLKLINKHFPRSNPLHKVINRMNTKVSYRTTSNMKQIISSHNKKLLRKSETYFTYTHSNCKDFNIPMHLSFSSIKLLGHSHTWLLHK